jgi:hypothetical protein
MIKKILVFFICDLVALSVSSQADSSWLQRPELTIYGFTDVFYVYDFSEPSGPERQTFLFNHNRHNEFNLNVALLRVEIGHERYRSTMAFHAGTYANDNYASEPGVLKNIFEASVGIALSKEKDLWLDAGVLPSHIGFESAISMDNLTLTRSLLAENSPYFLTGAKLTYEPDDHWQISGLILNGWQLIQRLEGNSLPSFGTQVTYSPDEGMTFNWSTYIGTDDPDISRRMRYFNNVYGQFQLSQKFKVFTGFDLGLQQSSKGSSNFDLWLSPVIIGQYIIDPVWKAALRMEYYRDETGIIISSDGVNGISTTGVSMNLDYSPDPNILCRIEGRWLNAEEKIFENGSEMSNNNFIIATSMAVKFEEIRK